MARTRPPIGAEPDRHERLEVQPARWIAPFVDQGGSSRIFLTARRGGRSPTAPVLGNRPRPGTTERQLVTVVDRGDAAVLGNRPPASSLSANWSRWSMAVMLPCSATVRAAVSLS